MEPDIYDTGGEEPVSDSDRRDRLIIDSFDAAEEHGQAVVDEAIEFAAERGQTAAGELRYGQPAKIITDFAEEGAFETLYVGHRGRSDRAIEILGSVARDVVEHATVPVTVVR